jgi:16S rRNA C967 or C1407 C5-methylase (RsmB/RsmF family)/NOL1/NOP2/fmu family ribosome biogenesis protein
MLPEAFIIQMKALLGAEYPAFEAAISEPAPVSIRFNPRHAGRLQPNGARPVPWHPDGYYLPERPIFTLDPAFHGGAYYVQEASSMFVCEALRQHADFTRRLKVLDLCAAPGGKSTLLVSMLGPDSLLLANEVIRTRTGVLRENLEKWGYPNTAVTSAEPEDIAAKLPGYFDIILTDAPCSGEGLFRRDPDAAKEWSPAQVDVCWIRQRRILEATVNALAPGGLLVYSTCTFNRLENEDNTAWLVANFDLVPLTLDIPDSWGVAGGSEGYHFYPHRVQGEGFFLAIFRKQGDPVKPPAMPSSFQSLTPVPKQVVPEVLKWLDPACPVRLFQIPSGEILALPATLEGDYLILDKALRSKWFGVNIGIMKGRDFIPSHALALNKIIAPTLPATDLDRNQALLFLKKEPFDLPAGTPQGWVLARYAGYNLGWMKVMPNRVNNYLPVERRIRMELGKTE